VAEASKHDTEEFMRRIGWLRPDAEMPTGSEPPPDLRPGSGSLGRRSGSGGGTPTDTNFGSGSTNFAAGDPPPLPFQRQLPPHMPLRPSPTGGAGAETGAASNPSMLPLPHQPSGALAQLLAAPRHQSHPQQSSAPGHGAQMPPLPTSQEVAPQMETKRARPRTHKRGTRAGSDGGFDYEAASAASGFIYSMNSTHSGGSGSGGAPPRGPAHSGGKGGGGVFNNAGGSSGNKRHPPPSSGNRSMSFAPSGSAQGKGGGRRY